MLQFISQPCIGAMPVAAPYRSSAAPNLHGAHQALPLEIGFLLAHGVPLDVLQMAATKAKRYDVSAEQVLLSEGKISQTAYYQALGKHIDLALAGEDVKLSAQAQFPHSILAGLCPAEDRQGAALWLIAPKGQQICELILLAQQNRLPRDHLRLITQASLQEQVMEARGKDIAEQAVQALSEQDQDWSAHTPANRLQRLMLVMGGLILLAGSLWQGSFVTFLGACLGLCLLASSLLRLYALTSELEEAPFQSHTPLPEDRLPIYTILVPLYREASVVDALISALDRLDYPAARLDIKLIVEEDDLETWRALTKRELPAKYQIIRAPEGQPRTKPRALNIALPLARGSLLTVYDAEDRPDPWQLRHAAALFASLPRRVACVQACLVIDNGADSWLARLFAIEYAALFDVFLPGLARLGLPLPLGGTSNHFRIDALRAVAGWDAWNVTEDIDLGLRMARAGYRMVHLPSATDEEAPATVSAWLRQRRRWLKGWIQTVITHLRDPLRLHHELGLTS
ncbi:MAG: glycosyltransferase, partial [Alphaproteobacteria bacterium]|nr:glycosyltransferase [Alphaproteobacteria bacterium]